jgi:RNA polymerase sigma factor (sigma-70 family)
MISKSGRDDTKLVEACIAQDHAAWTLFIEKFSNLISRSIANRLRKYGFTPVCEDTDDIRQEILKSIWENEKLKSVANRKNIAYWLSIVSGNVALEHMRKKGCGGEAFRFIPISETTDAESTGNPTPQSNEILNMIENSIASLPPRAMMIMKLNILHGMKHQEISEMMNLPIDTISSCIKRSKEKLKSNLKDFEK